MNENIERYEIWGCSHVYILQDIHEMEIWNGMLCRMEKIFFSPTLTNDAWSVKMYLKWSEIWNKEPLIL